MTKQHISRSYNRYKKRAVRHAQRQYRGTQRSFRVWRQHQYFLATALHDLRVAIAHNEDVFLGTAIAALTLTYAFAATASQLLFFSFQSLNALSDVTGLSMGALTIIGLGAVVTIAAWFMVLITNGLDIAVLDGAFRKNATSLRRTARQALARTPRVSLAWLLTLIVCGGGLLASSLPFGLFLAMHRHEPLSAAFVLAAATVLLVSLYGLSSFLLAPQVALYEPKLQLRETLSRSYRLSKPRGRLFITGLTLVLALGLTGAWELSVWLQQLLNYTGDIVFYILAMVELVLANLVLTMLYRKRKLARPVAPQPARLDWHRLSRSAPANS